MDFNLTFTALPWDLMKITKKTILPNMSECIIFYSIQVIPIFINFVPFYSYYYYYFLTKPFLFKDDVVCHNIWNYFCDLPPLTCQRQ